MTEQITPTDDDQVVKPAKKEPVVTVRVVGHLDDKAIVQWFEGQVVRRSLVTPSDVRLGNEPGTGLVEEVKLRRRSYGDDLVAMIDGLPDAGVIEDRLHQIGIWTAKDVVAHAPEVLGAFRATLNMAYQQFISKAREGSK